MEFFDVHHHHPNVLGGIYSLNLQERPPLRFFSAGIHPDWNGEDEEAVWNWLESCVTDPNCLAIGECGLDSRSPLDEISQQKLFTRQLLLAQELKKPVIIHCVRRYTQLMYACQKVSVPLIVHGFNKKESIGSELQKQDFYLSFGKSLLHNVNLQRFARDFPLNRTLLETDAADTEIGLLYEKLALLKELSIEELSARIAENLAIFNI